MLQVIAIFDSMFTRFIAHCLISSDRSKHRLSGVLSVACEIPSTAGRTVAFYRPVDRQFLQLF